MSNRRRLFFASLVTLFALVIAGGAFAQKPVLTVNANDPGRSPYTANVVLPACRAECLFSFPPVPAGHRLVITQVSLSYGSSYPGGGVRAVLLSQNSTSQSSIGLLPTASPVSTDPSNTQYVVSAPTTAYVEPGCTPVLAAVGHVDESRAEANLTGYLVALD